MVGGRFKKNKKGNLHVVSLLQLQGQSPHPPAILRGFNWGGGGGGGVFAYLCQVVSITH